MSDTTRRLAAAAATTLNTTFGSGTAETVPDREILILSRADALDPAIAAIRRIATPDQLAHEPIIIWSGRDEIVVGPAGEVELAHVMRGSRSRDVRIYTQPGAKARVVLSWIDGPLLAEISDVVAALPHVGLDVELLREDSQKLLDDVFDAVFALPELASLSQHSVMARVEAVRDSDDTYYELLDLTAALTHELVVHDFGLRLTALALAGQVMDPWVLDDVLDDLDVRMSGGEFFPVRAIDHHLLLVALFALAVTTAAQLPRAARRRVQWEFTADR